jgi:hypothetical protein
MQYPPNQPHHTGWTPLPDDTTIADDTTRTLPPAQQPRPARGPRGKPPRWPLLKKSSGRAHGSAYARKGRVYSPAPVNPAPRAVYAPRHDQRVYHAVRRRLPRFHVIHLILAIGVLALWVAITQPWGTDAAGTPIYIQQFSIPRISGPSGNVGPLALQTATFLAVAAVVMAAALLLINLIFAVLRSVLRRLRLTALAAVLFVPLFALLIVLLLADLTLAAGFGGLSIVSQLPFVRDHGFASIGVAHAAIGFYLWWFGIGATLIGTLGEIFIDRG